MDAVLSNPITYRGYYRDEENSFYYLQSRYYVPTWGRFLNADIPLYAQSQKDEFAGINLFVYCRNNPVNFSDPTGFKYVSEVGKQVVQIIVSLIELTSLEKALNKIPKPKKKKTTSKKSSKKTSKNHYSLSDFSIEGSLIFITAWNVLWDNIENYFPNSSSADFISASKLAFKGLDDFVKGWGIIGAFIQLSEYQDNPYKDWSKKENTIYSITSLCLNIIAVFLPLGFDFFVSKIGDIIAKVIILDKKHKVTL